MSEQLSGKGIGMLMAIHGAVRRDLERLARAAATLADPAVAAADRAVGVAGVTAYWTCFAEQLHHHHTIEDVEVWPHLRTTLGPEAASVLDAMISEHAGIDAAQAAAQTALEALAAEPTAAAADALNRRLQTFADVVLAHLSHEEEAAVPLILQGFDDAYWLAFMGRRQQDPGAETFLPWVLDGAPEPAAAGVTAELPPPVRELLVEQWQPQHVARVAALPIR
jgi:hemerythrin-like domain-containing protein